MEMTGAQRLLPNSPSCRWRQVWLCDNQTRTGAQRQVEEPQ